jgi:hypothetical protein
MYRHALSSHYIHRAANPIPRRFVVNAVQLHVRLDGGSAWRVSVDTV